MWTALLLTAAVLGLALVARAHSSLKEGLAEMTARLFPRRPVPARRLPRRLLARAIAVATVGVSGRTMMPGRIELRIHPEDLAPFRGALDWLRADIQSGVEERARAAGWDLPAGLVVDVISDATRPVGRPVAQGVLTRLHRARNGGRLPIATQPATTARMTQEAPTDELVTVAPGPLVEVRVENRPPVVVAVARSGIVLGRGHDSTIRIADRAASRAHCRIQRGTGGLTITDLSSTNGTRLDDSIVRDSSRLPVAGTLGIGGSRVRFRVLHENDVLA